MNGQRVIGHENGGAWRRRWFMSLTGLAMALFPWSVLAADHHASMMVAAFGPSMPSQVLVVADNSQPKSDSETVSTEYHPSVTYSGIYETGRLYRRNPDYQNWAGNLDPSHLKQVVCPQARVSLIKTGEWKGQLNKGGSCGPTAEPAEWALGNLLNYESELSETPANTK
jgi:hypothetical protein